MWAFSPLSGEGAAIHGGRFNPKGMPALYMSLSIDTAVTEAAQGFAGKLEPLTICLYEVDCDGIIDLSTPESRDAAGVDLAEMEAPWAWDRAEKRKPASVAVAERLIKAGAAGILVPSFARLARPDMRNLVLWRWGRDLPNRVYAYDLSGRLPKSKMSWDSEK